MPICSSLTLTLLFLLLAQSPSTQGAASTGYGVWPLKVDRSSFFY